MPEPDRPSRQALVVPPRSSNLPLAAVIIACGLAGCGLVWGLTGRGGSNHGPGAPAAVAPLPHGTAVLPHVIDSRSVTPASFENEGDPDVDASDQSRPQPDGGDAGTSDDRPLSRFSSPAPSDDTVPIERGLDPRPLDGTTPLAVDPVPTNPRQGNPSAAAAETMTGDRDAAESPADPAVPEELDPPPDTAAAFPPPKEGVRFLIPVDDDDPPERPAPSAPSGAGVPRDAALGLQEVALEDDIAAGPREEAGTIARLTDEDRGESLIDPIPATTSMPASSPPFDADETTSARLPVQADPGSPDDLGNVEPAPAAPAVADLPGANEEPAVRTPPAPDPAIVNNVPAPVAPASPFAQAPPLVDPSVAAPAPASVGLPDDLPAAGFVAPLAAQPAGPTGGLVPRFSSGDQTRRPPPVGAVAVSNPFIAAPPMAGTAAAGPAYDREQPAASAPFGEFASASGQGRPGPLQLEGVQSPQLTVEKRGPREVQVGRPARYEILVRNVGGAVANDVVLRDAVPVGTALVTTTPPAMPGRAVTGMPTDELVWPLGALPPGGQSRVVIELMPQAEGEIGSVASVTFRADASVRSRATRPSLAIECSPPAPVRIGGDATLAITVENPGTGIATGVVLEGFLPENVSHRSGRELEFDVGQLKPGEKRAIELVLGTRGPGIHTARLVARADGGLEVERPVRLEVTAPTLEVGVDMPLRRFLQRAATCEISLVNAGTAHARSVELVAQLPAGFKFVRANNAGWHDERTHRVLWNLEELPAGETGTVEVVVMPVELGPQKIVAAARSADGLADQATHVCEVEGLAALFFEVTDSEDPIEVNGVTEYVIRVGNQGTQAATAVRLVATLLGDLQPLAAQGPAGHRVENLTVAFEPLAKLAPSEEVVFRVRARGLSAGDQRVQVQLTSADHPAPITKEEVTRVYSDR